MALTPQHVLRDRILVALLSFDQCSARRKDLLTELDRVYDTRWTPEDRQAPNSRPFETKWKNRASYERADMVRDGLLKDRADGRWELTEAGRRAAERL